MGDRSAVTVWLFVILGYFLFLTVIMAAINSIAVTYSLDTSNITSSGGSTDVGGLDTTLNCERPRFEYDTDIYDISPNPLLSRGFIVDELTCESFQGFTWNPATDYLWGLYTSSATCEGALNLSYYTTNNATTTTYNNWHINTPVNELTLVSTDGGLCDALGFKWKDGFDSSFSTQNVFSFWGLISDIISLRLNFYTNSSFLNGLMTLIFIWLPLMGLAFVIYILVR